MSVQVFWQAPQPIDFPDFYFAGAVSPFRQLLRLFYSVPAQVLIGLFHQSDYDPELSTPATFLVPQGANWFALCRLWRDGTRFTWQGDGPLIPHEMAQNWYPFVAATDTGTLALAHDPYGFGLATPGGALLASALSAVSYYRVNDAWPMDIHTGEPLASLAILSNSYVGVLRPARGTAYRLHRHTAGPALTHTEILEEPGATVRFSSIYATSWLFPRDLLFIDSKTVAAVFAPFVQFVGIDYTLPSILRVFDTTSQPWTLRWEDTLPGQAHVAAWDPIHEILYASSRYPSNAILYSCRLARTPTAVAVPTLVGASALRELTATRISTLITDAVGSGIAGQLVRWTLSASLSGGALASAYSLTNASGVATMTYVGPRLPPAGLTEAVTVAVSEVDG